MSRMPADSRGWPEPEDLKTGAYDAIIVAVGIVAVLVANVA